MQEQFQMQQRAQQAQQANTGRAFGRAMNPGQMPLMQQAGQRLGTGLGQQAMAPGIGRRKRTVKPMVQGTGQVFGNSMQGMV
jgi:hypothetical protein